MKKTLLSLAMAGTIILTSCGSGQKTAKNEMAFSDSAKSDSAIAYSDSEAYGGAQEAQENIESSQLSYKQSEVKAIDTQMLIYSCDMSIDVLEFDQAVDRIHQLISKYKGFIESEKYSDGGNTSKWQYSDVEKWKNLTTVIRIPSSQYDNFCGEAEAIGDMRRKNASVQNLTTEYSDLKTTLSIYEAKEKRYLDILSELKSEQDAIQVENELTQIEIEIAKIKTRMNNIENDVAYSYIYLTLNEVREYKEQPVIERTDTFGQRLKNTVSRTCDNFLYFLENLLFVIIRLLPYLLLIALIVFVIAKLVKFLAKLSEKRRQKKYQQRAQQAPAVPQPPQFPQENMPGALNGNNELPKDNMQ